MATAREKMGRARNARLNQAHQYAERVQSTLAELRSFPDEGVFKDHWFKLRNTVEQLVQCVHEANAYNNAMVTVDD